MPIYEFECPTCKRREEHWANISERDSFVVYCEHHGLTLPVMKRLPGGHGMLYFEEGRGRVHLGLSDKPITSYSQHKRLMRDKSAIEAGSAVPRGIQRKGAVTEKMKRYMSKDHRGRWL